MSFFAKLLRFGLVCGTLVLSLSAQASRQLQYRVTEDIFTLEEVSTFLYGTPEKAQQIASWNELQPPYRIQAGQTLRLELSPTVSPQKGRSLVLQRRLDRFSGVPTRGEPSVSLRPAALPPMSRAKYTRSMALLVARVATEPESLSEAPKSLSQGRILLEQGQVEQALGAFKSARQEDPNLVSAWMLELQSLKRLGRMKELKTSLSQLLQRHPDLSDTPVIRNYQKSVGDLR